MLSSTCPTCEKSIRPNAHYCNHCGSRIPTFRDLLEAPKDFLKVPKMEPFLSPTCPACGKLNRPNARYCNNCGHRILVLISERQYSTTSILHSTSVELAIEFLGITASIATIAQTILMVVDMWSKKEKKNKTGVLHQKAPSELEDIKEIIVLMNDGERCTFKAWQHQPDEVKKFVETFQSIPTGPKPVRVTFILKSGSKLRVNVGDNTEDQQKQLDEVIRQLKN